MRPQPTPFHSSACESANEQTESTPILRPKYFTARSARSCGYKLPSPQDFRFLFFYNFITHTASTSAKARTATETTVGDCIPIVIHDTRLSRVSDHTVPDNFPARRQRESRRRQHPQPHRTPLILGEAWDPRPRCHRPQSPPLQLLPSAAWE